MLVYVSGPLQGAVDLASARELYARVADAVRALGHQAYVPHLHTDPETASELTPASVYDRDVAALTSADVIVAHLGAPSTGVGAELVLAWGAGLRLVGLRRRGETVSRFAEGLLDRAGGDLLVFDGDSDQDLRAVLGAALNAQRSRRGGSSPPLAAAAPPAPVAARA